MVYNKINDWFKFGVAHELSVLYSKGPKLISIRSLILALLIGEVSSFLPMHICVKLILILWVLELKFLSSSHTGDLHSKLISFECPPDVIASITATLCKVFYNFQDQWFVCLKSCLRCCESTVFAITPAPYSKSSYCTVLSRF